jgi:hypothetical protein
MNRTRTPRRPLRPGWLLTLPLGIVFSCCAGCGGTAAPSDPGEGRKALEAALDAWKANAKPDTLARRTPAIHVSDGDWMSGFRLQNYQAAGEGRLVGSDVNFDVVLELKTARGAVVKKSAVYAVTTHPQLLVLRQDSL